MVMDQALRIRLARATTRQRLAASITSETLGAPASARAPRPPVTTWRRRVTVVGAIFLVAAVTDLATGQSKSPFLGSAAISLSVPILFPAWRRAMLRVVTVLSAWLLFNVVGRAVADGTSAPLADQHLVAHLERSLFGELPSAWLQSVGQAIPSSEALEASLTAVYLSFFAVPIVMAAITATAPVAVFRVAALSSALCLLIGLACFALHPTSPPPHRGRPSRKMYPGPHPICCRTPWGSMCSTTKIITRCRATCSRPTIRRLCRRSTWEQRCCSR